MDLRARPIVRFATLVFVLGTSIAACGKRTTAPTKTACASDSDCVFSCDQRGQCCPTPCGCHTPMLATEAAAAAEHNRESCTKADRERCPVVGACGPPGDPEVARCRAGVCVAEKVDAGARPPGIP